MVKHFKEEIRKEQFIQEDKLKEKAQLLRQLRKRDFFRDTKRHCLKNSLTYAKPKLNLHEFLTYTSSLTLAKNPDATAIELHSYKSALQCTETVLEQLSLMKIKNERPADYLVQMYKSDKQMFKVRRYLTEKEQKLKEKMQGKDWQSKNKRREKAKKKAEIKKEKKKSKLAAKRPSIKKPKMDKVNGKRKIKK